MRKPRPGDGCPVCGNRRALERKDQPGVVTALVCRYCQFTWEQE